MIESEKRMKRRLNYMKLLKSARKYRRRRKKNPKREREKIRRRQ